jgi:glycogen(starch) synthase
MRIAYVSFEYPPDTALGGIATYVYQVSRMMKDRGHDIEVFCASPTRSVSEDIDGIKVHRVLTESRYDFPQIIVSVFAGRHSQNSFDVIESPEYSGDGKEIKKLFPDLPLVVKLHTPTAFIAALDSYYSSEKVSAYKKTRYIVGGLVKGQIRKGYWKNGIWWNKSFDDDYSTTVLADQVHTPSISLGDIVSVKWGIKRNKILNVPYPFIPNEDFLKIPISKTETKNVTFIGRLEIRKGLIELVKAIPLICQAVPEAKFRFVGRTLHSPVPGMTMREYIELKLEKYKDRIEFIHVTPPQIPQLLSETDVCVFPSIWENFPNVCLEAMSAGRAIVGSDQGGMVDMLQTPRAGILVDPMSSNKIAKAIIYLLGNSELRVTLGIAARDKALSAYNSDRIGTLMESLYSKLIKGR